LVTDPLVSVIVTLYNYENFISHCIQSILNQNYFNFEVVVVDDSSIDKSYERAKKFQGDKVRIIRFDKNRGYSAAKNEGIRNSKGEYIVMLDADDMLTKDSISKRMQAMLNHDADFVHANAFIIKGNYSIKQCYKITNFPIGVFPSPYDIHAQSVILKKQIHRDFGLYDETLRSRSDREMWWRLFGKSKEDEIKNRVKRVYINKPVVYYRYHRNMMTRLRQKNKDYDKKVRSLSKIAYNIRKKGITKGNTLFLQ